MGLVKKCMKKKEIGACRMPTGIKNSIDVHNVNLNVSTRTYTVTGVFIVTLNDSWYPGCF